MSRRPANPNIHMMSQTDTGSNATWHKIIALDHNTTTISWGKLLDIAALHYAFLRDNHPRDFDTGGGNALVAALFMPSEDGAIVFLGTIPRGARRQEMMRNGYQDAPIWWDANVHNNSGPSRLCAEDNVEYLFETDRRARSRISRSRGYRPAPGEEGQFKLAVYGRFQGYPSGPVELCNGGPGSKRPVPCKSVAVRLNIDYWTPEKQEAEERRIAESRAAAMQQRSQASGSSRNQSRSTSRGGGY